MPTIKCRSCLARVKVPDRLLGNRVRIHADPIVGPSSRTPADHQMGLSLLVQMRDADRGSALLSRLPHSAGTSAPSCIPSNRSGTLTRARQERHLIVGMLTSVTL